MPTLIVQFRRRLRAEEVDRLEDGLDELLRENELGYCSGHGTDLQSNKSDLSLEVSNIDQALPLVRSELKRLKAPWFTRVNILEVPARSVNVEVGQVILVPLDEERHAIGKVLCINEYDIIMLGIYGLYKSDWHMDQLQDLPLIEICTHDTALASGDWKTLGIVPLSISEKSLYPIPDFNIVGIVINTAITAPRSIVKKLNALDSN